MPTDFQKLRQGQEIRAAYINGIVDSLNDLKSKKGTIPAVLRKQLNLTMTAHDFIPAYSVFAAAEATTDDPILLTKWADDAAADGPLYTNLDFGVLADGGFAAKPITVYPVLLQCIGTPQPGLRYEPTTTGAAIVSDGGRLVCYSEADVAIDIPGSTNGLGWFLRAESFISFSSTANGPAYTGCGCGDCYREYADVDILGCDGMSAYQIWPECFDTGIAGGAVYLFLQEDGSYLSCPHYYFGECDPSAPASSCYKLEISGLEAGEVTLSLMDYPPTTMRAQWISMHKWKPACGLRLAMNAATDACTCRWPQEMCMRPFPFKKLQQQCGGCTDQPTPMTIGGKKFPYSYYFRENRAIWISSGHYESDYLANRSCAGITGVKPTKAIVTMSSSSATVVEKASDGTVMNTWKSIGPIVDTKCPIPMVLSTPGACKESASCGDIFCLVPGPLDGVESSCACNSFENIAAGIIDTNPILAFVANLEVRDSSYPIPPGTGAPGNPYFCYKAGLSQPDFSQLDMTLIGSPVAVGSAGPIMGTVSPSGDITCAPLNGGISGKKYAFTTTQWVDACAQMTLCTSPLSRTKARVRLYWRAGNNTSIAYTKCECTSGCADTSPPTEPQCNCTDPSSIEPDHSVYFDSSVDVDVPDGKTFCEWVRGGGGDLSVPPFVYDADVYTGPPTPTLVGHIHVEYTLKNVQVLYLGEG